MRLMELKTIVSRLNQFDLKALLKFSRRARVPYSTVLKIRHGTTRYPRTQTASKIAKALAK